jgi:hypothetical protein
METPPSPELVLKALRKIMAAIEGMGEKAVAIGAIARRAWGAKEEPRGVELMIQGGDTSRERVLGAARGEGLRQTGASPLSLSYTDPKAGGTVAVELVAASTPFHQQIGQRAQRGMALQVQMLVATCEDLILLSAASPKGETEVVELLRHNAGRIDAAYVKKEAEAQGIFDRVKTAWAEAKRQG